MSIGKSFPKVYVPHICKNNIYTIIQNGSEVGGGGEKENPYALLLMGEGVGAHSLISFTHMYMSANTHTHTHTHLHTHTLTHTNTHTCAHACSRTHTAPFFIPHPNPLPLPLPPPLPSTAVHTSLKTSRSRNPLWKCQKLSITICSMLYVSCCTPVSRSGNWNTSLSWHRL